jgi:hypothetical protein
MQEEKWFCLVLVAHLQKIVIARARQCLRQSPQSIIEIASPSARNGSNQMQTEL